MSRALLLVAFLALVPELSHACAVCGSALDDDGSRVAYLVTSAVLSVLPLALFGGILLWLRAKSRRQSAAQAPPRLHH